MVEYVEQESLDVERAERMMSAVSDNTAMYPWVLIEMVVSDTDDTEVFRMNVLKPLVKKGYLMVNADGKVIVDDRKDFFADYDV